jgi:Haem-dependent oxidative N-demethylase, alpha subunit-like
VAKRYPQVFRVHRVSDDGDLGGGDSIVGNDGGRVKTIEILPTGDKWDLDVDDPMTVAGLLADDIAIMVEGDDGRYYMRAGSICVPGAFIWIFSSFVCDRRNSILGSWRLVDKIGLPLADIHLKGNVYKYKEVLQFSMDRWAHRDN